MSYYSRVYRHRNPKMNDENGKEPFFSKQSDSNNSEQKSAFFQAKLSVNAPGDRYEQEADSVANAVVNQQAKAPVVQQKELVPEKEKMKGIQKKDTANDEKKKKVTPVQTKQETTEMTASPSVSSKIESSSGKGNSLPAKTQHEMSASFGTDFSNVKVHNDGEAQNINQELQSQAFTHGRDIYFNAGRYQPENNEGKLLLAHELTHVVQQGEGVHTKQIQRSFWGTVGGVVAGAVGGFFVGGPVGAIVGGVAGGVAGDAATTDTRGLNKDERQEAQKVFGNSLNYDAVSVSDSSKLMQAGGYARTPGNTVFFPTGTLGRSDPAYYAFLIHELTHTWQTQHGVSVFTKIRYSLSQSNYDFGGDAGLQKAIEDGKCFNDFNTEAQASILEKYYEILTGQASGDGLLYYHFVSQVQNFAGKCEPAGIKEDSLDPKYRGAESQSNSFA
ncbi:MAG TPA: DUF4157 domain-containing protein [Hanamia sp.]|nr:DUF4157 domain-containing protein [Hanamia sp.]